MLTICRLKDLDFVVDGIEDYTGVYQLISCTREGDEAYDHGKSWVGDLRNIYKGQWRLWKDVAYIMSNDIIYAVIN